MKNKDKPPFVVELNTDDGEVTFLDKEGYPPILSLLAVKLGRQVEDMLETYRTEYDKLNK